MVRTSSLFGSIIGVLATAIPAAAATIYLDAQCGPNPVTITATSATCIYQGSTVSSALNETGDLSHIMVTASISPPAGPTRRDVVETQIRYDADLSITFIAPPGVSGEGAYSPCVSARPHEGYFVQGWLDWVGSGESSGLPDPTCSRFDLRGLLPLTFGVPQVRHLHLSAGAGMFSGTTYTGDAYASLNGFRVYDSHFKELTGVQWVVTEVPEPALGLPMLVAFAVIVWKRRLANVGIRRC